MNWVCVAGLVAQLLILVGGVSPAGSLPQQAPLRGLHRLIVGFLGANPLSPETLELRTQFTGPITTTKSLKRRLIVVGQAGTSKNATGTPVAPRRSPLLGVN